ncbi:MAG: hypothetical protein KC442_19955 [Thermomicrobiales bacterium]|nr:hypothetical protein [Thermomicrobiales bacterium]
MSAVIDRLATSVATRRGTLALGSAALLGLAQERGASARKKSCKKKSQRKVDQACGRQVDECVAYFTPFCTFAPNPQQCLTSVNTCCAPLESCRFTEMMQCAATI